MDGLTMRTLLDNVRDLVRHVGIGVELGDMQDWDASQIHSAASWAVQTALHGTARKPRPIQTPPFLCQYPSMGVEYTKKMKTHASKKTKKQTKRKKR